MSFDREQFIQVFESYNGAIYPLQWAPFALELSAVLGLATIAPVVVVELTKLIPRHRSGLSGAQT